MRWKVTVLVEAGCNGWVTVGLNRSRMTVGPSEVITGDPIAVSPSVAIPSLGLKEEATDGLVVALRGEGQQAFLIGTIESSARRKRKVSTVHVVANP